MSVYGQPTLPASTGPGQEQVSVRTANLFKRRAAIGFICYFASISGIWWLIDLWLPDRVTFAILGHVFAISDLHHHIIAVGIFTFVLVPAVFAIELASVGWLASSVRHLLFVRSPSMRTDIVTFLMWQFHVISLIKLPLTFGASLFSGYWLHEQVLNATGFDLSLRMLPLPTQYFVYFLLFTFFDYWNHRLDHSRYFWPIHRYHHSAEELYVLTSVRTHPAIFSGIIATTLPLGLINTPAEIVFWVNIVFGIHRFVIHSRIDSDFGWVGRYLIQSPVHHRLHHILDTSMPASHYALVPIWDHLFGTWRGGGNQQIVIGVADPYRHGAWVVGDMWRDYREFLSGIFRRAARQPAPETTP